MISKYAANLALNTLFGEAYVGLYKEDDTEVSALSYSRKRIFFKAADNGETSNIGNTDFKIAAENWGIIAKVGLFDNTGKLLIKKELDFKKEVRMTDNYIISQGQIVINFKNIV